MHARTGACDRIKLGRIECSRLELSQACCGIGAYIAQGASLLREKKSGKASTAAGRRIPYRDRLLERLLQQGVQLGKVGFAHVALEDGPILADHKGGRRQGHVAEGLGDVAA